jgi:hypothetical protein
MALIDMDHGVVRVKIVYDGPPHAGKTATLHALEQKLSSNRFVQPLDGMDINLLEYQGGMYDHMPIACQILTTPSDPQWSKRRQFLLNQADAIVLVLDTNPDALPLGLEYLRQLREFLQQLPPPVPLFLIQANCQDNPLALDMNKLHDFFIDSSIKIMEASIEEGLGIRETFVMAVRLAVERLNALKENFQLFKGKFELKTAEEWINILHIQQTDPESSILSSLIHAPKLENNSPEISPTNAIHADISEIILPNSQTPLKWLFPALLTQNVLSQLNDLSNISETNEGWISTNQQWAILSRPEWHYVSEKGALAALQQQIRWHSQAVFGISKDRCLALSCNEHGWHLWQISPRVCLEFAQTSVDEFIIQLLTAAKYISQTLQRLNKFIPVSEIILEHFDLKGNFYGRLNSFEETLKESPIEKTVELCLPVLTSTNFETELLLNTLEEQETHSPQFAQLFANHLLP